MARLTVDFGVDLGTTNTVVAVKDRRGPTVLMGPDNTAAIPSALHVMADGNVVVGAGAKALANEDEDNTVTRWKRTMGKGADAKKTFAASGLTMTPEEMSAEVLKSVRQTIRDRRNEEPREIVITIPAGFKTGQTKATQRAATLAGFKTVYLLTEPIAAALAYGAEEIDQDATWMVYDFGGGTFDATIIELLEDMPTVVSHAGNNFLGGTDFDHDIVSKILRPAFASGRDLPKFNARNKYWRGIVARLVEAAEDAKIRVCRTREDAKITIQGMPLPDSEEVVDFTHTLTVEEVEKLTRPYVAKTMSLCRECLEEGKIDINAIDKVILVGGSSMNPWVREAVAENFGCPLEISKDPMSVVAEGAAIFAGQLTAEPPEVSEGKYQLRISSPLVNDISPVDFVAKVVAPKGESLPSGMEIEFEDIAGAWTSGRVPVRDNGTVRTSLRISETEGAEFKVTLTRTDGVRVDCEPDMVPISPGIVAPNPPLANHYGIGLATGEMKPILKRGQVLPARGKGIVRTTRELRKGDAKDYLAIPIYEGTNPERFSRNVHLITVRIPGTDVPRNVPVGTEVEVTLRCDLKTRDLTAELFLPDVEELLVKAQIQLDDRVPDPEHIGKSLDQEKARFADISERATEIDDPQIAAQLDALNTQEDVDQIDRLLSERGDADALTMADEQIRRFAEEIDAFEDALKFPELVAQVQENIDELDEKARKLDPSMLASIEGLRGAINQAIRDRSSAQLRSLSQEVDRQATRLRENDVEFWGAAVGFLRQHRDDLSDPSTANMLFEQIERAIQANDLETIKAACRQLASYLPNNIPFITNVTDVA